jgi:hypothetical protein
MRFARLAQVAIIAGSLVIGTQAPAGQTLYGNHYDETIPFVSCPSSTYCQLLFSQLPSNKLTLVHRATCRFTTTSPVYVANLQISATTSGATLGRWVQLTLQSAFLGGYYFTTVDIDPEFLIGQSRYPLVEVYTVVSNTISMECTLSGELVTPVP